MKKLFPLLALLLLLSTAANAQRVTDVVDRGLVAVSVSDGVFLSWRIFGEEYYDVDYNLYRDGVKVNAAPLSVSNYTDVAGTPTSTYTVAPVVRGVEQEQSAAVKVWRQQYMDIPMQPVINRNGKSVNADYSLNDVSLADVDGDGVTEFIVKRNSATVRDYSSNKYNFHRLECYNIQGKRLWYIDLGPNMISGPDEQYDIVGYDWDGDGKAEMLMRGADNMIIHKADGTTVEVGNMNFDSRNTLMSDANMAYTHTGNEYLLYLNGETAEPYVVMPYPLPRLENGQNNLEAVWGDGYGHRSTKHYFAAPYLDGRKPSIFLGRGAYTIHKMCALDVNPETHELTLRWRWDDPGGQWRGQGYHNFGVADVDLDGRDEIVFGSMVIDDNGKGLSTTGLGHGDAQHTGDLDPYRWGLEHFACNEDNPAMNYRNATTSKIYYRLQGTGDDGRALCGNFTNQYPGCVGKSASSAVISTVADKPLPGLPGFDLNFRIYWDGDLCEEILNSPGTEGTAKIDKMVGSGITRIFTSSDTKMNNWTKNNPGATGDILGDWREEMVLRTSDNAKLRIYTTVTPTPHRIYTLWHDHQYRNAMVWQSMGYNQPPHVSYFIGELEGITMAPPPLTMNGRVEVTNGGTVGAEHNGKHAIVCEMNSTEVSIAHGASPHVATFNVASHVQGTTNNNNIIYEKDTCVVTGGGLAGAARLVKQGDGVLCLPKVEMTHTGNTDIWAGTVNFDGTMKHSPLYLSRFAELNSDGGEFHSIRMDYASVLRPGGAAQIGEITADSLALGFGSFVEIDICGADLAADLIKARSISLETKDWNYGPEYMQPVFRFVIQDGTELADGAYTIAMVDNIVGDIASIKVIGTGSKKAYLTHADGKLSLVVEGVRGAATIVWSGAESAIWNYAADHNFLMDGTPTYFVEGDDVYFTDEAVGGYNVQIATDLPADTVFVDNSEFTYTMSGAGAISGNATLVKTGKSKLVMRTDNTYTGGNRISGGTVSVSSLSNANQSFGNLGGVTSQISKFVIENGAILETTAAVQMGSPIRLETPAGGVISNSADFVMNRSFSGTKLTKRGSGWLKTHATGGSLDTMVIAAGTVENHSGNAAKVVEFQNGTLNELVGTSNTMYIPAGRRGTWSTANRQTYSNKITGKGTITVYCATEKGSGWYATRTPMRLNTAEFEGTFIPQAVYAADGRFTFDTGSGMPNATMEIPDGIVVQNSGKSFTIGALAGKGSLGGGCTFSNSSSVGANTWRVGSLGTDFRFTGSITGSGTKFEKVGAGTMTVSGSNDFSGSAVISEGTLCLNNTSAFGTGTMTVADGATLCGKGTLKNSSVTVKSGGTLYAGNKPDASSGAIAFANHNLTIEKGALLSFSVYSTGSFYTKLEDIATLTVKGTLKVNLRDGIAFKEGDELQLWEAEKTTLAFDAVCDIDSIGGGLTWDTSDFKSGILRVANAMAVEHVDVDEEVCCVVYGTDGTEQARFACTRREIQHQLECQSLPRGIYVVQMTAAKMQWGRKYVVK